MKLTIQLIDYAADFGGDGHLVELQLHAVTPSVALSDLEEWAFSGQRLELVPVADKRPVETLFGELRADYLLSGMHDGETAEVRDVKPLSAQRKMIFCAMRGRGWVTLDWLQWYLKTWCDVRASEAGISARLRDLRKEEFGAHTVERRRGAGRTYQYRLLINPAAPHPDCSQISLRESVGELEKGKPSDG